MTFATIPNGCRLCAKDLLQRDATWSIRAIDAIAVTEASIVIIKNGLRGIISVVTFIFEGSCRGLHAIAMKIFDLARRSLPLE
jgi:hypothetical protein